MPAKMPLTLITQTESTESTVGVFDDDRMAAVKSSCTQVGPFSSPPRRQQERSEPQSPPPSTSLAQQQHYDPQMMMTPPRPPSIFVASPRTNMNDDPMESFWMLHRCNAFDEEEEGEE
mmetsp:Transcript_9215/g.19867  ORF Transcript_9215/g.19867 Transcript_9215/m.19867 type:complete len:118 (-) Transcript_9215:1376-1729(-)|eukprot:CAMPEP_0168744368 /NCGR_PEP_ID=MMETSP0724-20121128/14055_1 /TAXON_ID=265536 /ORGANISM="Amphiprora sp., Strain CCMP467" /LENGTH=117 /DNA_ID=CAMNT_0008792025 /DNA_START=120 /DNA_END=473 /DNA_ORIENTATION=+